MSQPTFTIRQLTSNFEDATLFKMLRIETVINEPTAFLPTAEEIEGQDDEFWQTITQKFGKTAYIYVAYNEQNQPIGILGLYLETNQKIAGVGKLYHMYVIPEFRRHGLGQALMKAAITTARKLGLRMVTLDLFATQKAAYVFYKNYGFIECGRIPEFFEVTMPDDSVQLIDKIDMYLPLTQK